MTLFKKEWKLVMMPVPLLFLLLSGLVLIPNYPYYVTFFYSDAVPGHARKASP